MPEETTWLSSPAYHQPSPLPKDIENKPRLQIARWLIEHVLGDPSRLDSFMEARLTRDLLYGTTTATTAGMYYNESSSAFEGKNMRPLFGLKEAHQQMVNMCNRNNHWHQQRARTYGL